MAKKKVQDQGAQIPRNAAQHRYWTFYEAIKIETLNLGRKAYAIVHMP